MPYYITPIGADDATLTIAHCGQGIIRNRRPHDDLSWTNLNHSGSKYPQVKLWRLVDAANRNLGEILNPYHDPEAKPINGIYYPTGRTPYECGHNDFYYHRSHQPHHIIAGKRVFDITDGQASEYRTGYADAETLGDRKEWE